MSIVKVRNIFLIGPMGAGKSTIGEQKVIDELTQKTNIVLATGGGVVITPENRNALAGRGTVIYLKTSLQQQFERTKRDNKRPLLQTEDLEGRLESLRDEREPFYDELADVSFETDKLTVKAVANNIIKYIRRRLNHRNEQNMGKEKRI